MPKKEIDYSKTVMYKIVCTDLNIKDLYVGHTTSFTKRKNQHKACSNNPNDPKYKYKVYQTIRENGGWENWSMIEIEKYPCTDSNEATTRERYWCESLKANLNSHIPKMHQETTKEYMKDYYTDNKSELLQKQKLYNKINKSKIGEQRKVYRDNNKEMIKQYRDNYRILNREKLNEQKGEICICECGHTYTRNHRKRHTESAKHIKFMNDKL